MISLGSCGEKKYKTYKYYINPQIWYLTSLWDSSSYWIMTDSSTNQLDCLYVYNSTSGYESDGSSDYSDHHVWEEKVNYINDYKGSDTFAFMSFNVTAYSYWAYNEEMTTYDFSFSKRDSIFLPLYGYIYYGHSIISIPKKIPNKWFGLFWDTSGAIHSNSCFSNSELLTTCTINNQIYDSVYHVQTTCSDSLLHLNDEFFYNRKHGILKIVQNNISVKRTLTLVREHLLKQ